MTVLYFLLLLLSAVCFVLVLLRVSEHRINFLGLGLLFWVLVPLIQMLQKL